MSFNNLEDWEAIFSDYIIACSQQENDASHDLGHFRRVYHTAKYIANCQSAPVDMLVILASAYFHDIISLPKDHPNRNMASQFAALKAKEILQRMHFPSEKIDFVCHAITTHSFSAGLQPETLEAKIIQDADRMEALGALGAMRTFYVSGRLGREPFDPDDLHAERRSLDDKIFGLDHFYVKLFKLPHLLQTYESRFFANKRLGFLKYFVEELEVNVKKKRGGALFVVKACYDAGSQGLQLFDLLDPLSLYRSLNPTLFVIDKVIEAHKQFPVFITKFLTQFQEEIGV